MILSMMDKVRFIKNEYETRPVNDSTIDARFRKNRWTPEEIQDLKKEYPYLPDSYINFIKEFDSPGIAWVSFYGSNLSEIISVREEIEYWKNLLKTYYFPFGKDTIGDVYCFNKK